ncbi:MAG: hypothetical protein LBE90_09200 [Pantoea dispersa]|jgi:hypothetical protein|nr:hypothetical protein [Pantoea dispersa]MBZ6390665.1 hypothetical protein [Pantoea dispersa]
MSSFWARLVASVRDNSEQRINNPFYGAFIFSWIVFNWKAIAIFIFSERSIYLKIDDMTNVTSFESLVSKPIIMTITMLSIIPILNAVYALFDVTIKACHKYSELYDSYINSVLAIRKQTNEARVSIQKELTLAKERAVIAQEEKRAEEFKLEASLARNNVQKIEELETLNSNLLQEKKEIGGEYNKLFEKAKKFEATNAEFEKLKQASVSLSKDFFKEREGHAKTKELLKTSQADIDNLQKSINEITNKFNSYKNAGLSSVSNRGQIKSEVVTNKEIIDAVNKVIGKDRNQ